MQVFFHGIRPKLDLLANGNLATYFCRSCVMAYYVQFLNAISVCFQQTLNKLIDETHLRVLRLLEANPAMSQRELADALGVSLGKTNYCVRALLDKGLIKMKNFRNSQNKAAYAYYLTPAGMRRKAGLTTRFLKMKITEYEALKREIEQLRAEVAGTA